MASTVFIMHQRQQRLGQAHAAWRAGTHYAAAHTGVGSSSIVATTATCNSGASQCRSNNASQSFVHQPTAVATTANSPGPGTTITVKPESAARASARWRA